MSLNKISAWLSVNNNKKKWQNWIAYTSCNLKLLELRMIVEENCIISQTGKQIKPGPSSSSF